jgi:hypothetical protein
MALLVAALEGQSRELLDTLLMRLPTWVRRDERMLRFLTHENQVQAVWVRFLDGNTHWWSSLSWQARILCIYRAAKEDVAPGAVASLADDHPFVRAALAICRARSCPREASQLSRQAHDLIEQTVAQQVWDRTEPLDLYPILPLCGPRKVTYCEGYPWLTVEERHQGVTRTPHAMCPRAGYPYACFVDHVTAEASTFRFPQVGSRLYPDLARSWQYWSWLELLHACGVIPNPPNIAAPGGYVQQLSGWINRINEIRSRLRCRHCQAMMVPNYGYGRHLPIYRVTVFGCTQAGAEHNHDIYLSHCWACKQIIDSRDIGAPKVGNRYICLHCGSGPMNPTDFRQGDICPACGAPDMIVEGRHPPTRRCTTCGRLITLPPRNKVTGSGALPANARWYTHLLHGDNVTVEDLYPRGNIAGPPDDDAYYESLAEYYEDTTGEVDLGLVE